MCSASVPKVVLDFESNVFELYSLAISQYCAIVPNVIQRFGPPLAVPPNGIVAGSASCEPGEEVVGGSYDLRAITVSAAATSHVIKQEIIGQEWSVNVANSNPNASNFFNSIAFCMSAMP